ncbi:MAG: capsule assembly Wzi family protein [Prevotella sp.]|jgi:hypothetical protein|nr:capsule assembly Wzi family protein [Prevotella sp.]MCI1281178.1 capsule assembly Wzi family protein [Prevotella sp.]
MKKIFILSAFLLALTNANAQYAWQDGAESGKLNLGRNLQYNIELQGSSSSEKTPLWLNANKYGLSSLEKNNGYIRGSIIRPLSTDSARRWGIGYGLDVAAAYHYTSVPIVQQAFVELRWLHGVLSVGSKQYPMELKNNALSSGSQTLGINARPVPQVRLALPEYWTLPIFGGWLHMKGHVSFGKMTDDKWQHDFTDYKHRYADDILYHSKAGYLMIGNPDRFMPFSIEMGLEMATIFGGTSYSPQEDGTVSVIKGGTGIRDFWHAFMPGGSDPTETTYQNVEGDQLGSWLLRINYDADTWRFGIYADKFFEDHSSMLQLDYDGYGSGENWQSKEKHRYLLYDFKDWMLGAEFNFKYSRWLKDIVFEYLYTEYQSGPIYHDHTSTISDHIGGNDDFYNHYIYVGWQHWGQVMGNPLYRSPIYNNDGKIEVQDNRFMAFHLGFDGNPTENLSYRVLATYQEGLGTYASPYTKKHHNVSFMVETAYQFKHNWQVKGAYGMDFGHILGNNYGFQLTISKSGIFNL